jgi:hypothetical protein
MQDTINSIEAVVSEDFHTSNGFVSESQLSEEITQLWSVHTQTKTTIDRTKAELRTIRLDLGARLCEMKKLLSRPGRNGQWSSWLHQRRIPRATADRLVIRYEQSLNPDANRLNETISEPTEEEIQKLFNSMRPKLRRILATPQGLYRFVDLLTSSCDRTCRRVTAEGILILKPLQADSVAPSAGEHEAEPQSVLAQSIVGFDQELM